MSMCDIINVPNALYSLSNTAEILHIQNPIFDSIVKVVIIVKLMTV